MSGQRIGCGTNINYMPYLMNSYVLHCFCQPDDREEDAFSMMLFQYVTKLTLAVSRSNVQRKKYPSDKTEWFWCWRAYMKISLNFYQLPNKALLHSACGEGQPRPPVILQDCHPGSGVNSQSALGVASKGRQCTLTGVLIQPLLRAQPHPSDRSKWDVKSRPWAAGQDNSECPAPLWALRGADWATLLGPLPVFHSALILRSHLKLTSA